MPDCLLVLYWPDFSGDGRSLGDGPAPLSAPLIAHALQRQLSLRFEEYAACVWVPDPAFSEAVAAFERWGIRRLEREPDSDEIGALTRRFPDVEHVIMAAHPHRAAGAIPCLHECGCTVEVWAPGGASNGILPEGTRAAALADALGLTTAQPVAVFAEWEHVEGALKRLHSPGDLVTVRQALLRSAELVGQVVTARVYRAGAAPYLELAGTTPLHDETEESGAAAGFHDTVLRDELLALTGEVEAPRTWILCTSAPWLGDVVRAAGARGIRTLLWAEDAEEIPPDVRAAASGAESLTTVLSLRDAFRERPRTGRSDRVVFKPLQASVTEAVTPRESGSPFDVPLLSAEGQCARLAPWVRLVYRIECLLRQHHWSKIAFRKLAASLAESDEFGPTPANVLMWLNRAKAEGMLVVEQEPHRADPSIRVTTCRPNAEHPVSRAAVEVPDRCLRLLHQMLQKMPWVSFKLLRSVLRRDQWLGRPPYRLDEASIDEWLNFLIHDGAITMTKEPNLVNPDYPVTALRLNERHPISRAVAAEAVEGTRLAAERAILAVDHFITRQRKPWMSMTALRRSLDGMVREELQEVLQALQSLGALVTESYPNPQKEHFTTGCRLKLDEPIVLDALNTRNAIIRVAQYHQRFRSWVPLAKVDEELAERQPSTAWAGQRLAWFLLLRDEGILELDHEGPLPESTWGTIRCRLNVADPVVRSVVADASDGSASHQTVISDQSSVISDQPSVGHQ